MAAFFADCPGCEAATNEALEFFAKAAAENPDGDDRGIWAPHPNVAIRAAVEDTTRRLLRRLEALADAFARAVTGDAPGPLAKADPPWTRLDPVAFAAIRQRLESRDPSTYTLEDWLALVDVLMAEHMPPGALDDEAERLAVRADLLGRIQAILPAHRPPSLAEMAHLAELVPTSFAKIPPRVLTPVELATLRVAKARAADRITALSDDARRLMRGAVIEHTQAQLLGQKEGTPGALRQRLFDGFSALGRDVRRIAVTETGECCNAGFIAAMKPGAKVRRLESYQGACAYCASVRDRVFTVVDPAKPDKDGEREVWRGKSQTGRSASPRKRVGDALVEREAHERWWVPEGVIHQHCRGGWALVGDASPAVSPEFASWLGDLIARHSPAARADRAADAAP